MAKNHPFIIYRSDSETKHAGGGQSLMQPGSSTSFGGFVVSGKPVTIDVPRGHRFHLSGASLALDAHPGRVVLSIRRRKPFGDEPPGTFPIAVLRAGRFESVTTSFIVIHVPYVCWPDLFGPVHRWWRVCRAAQNWFFRRQRHWVR